MRIAQMLRAAIGSALLLIANSCAADGNARDRVNLFPKLQAGEVYSYQVRYQSNNKMKTESAVAAPIAPDATATDLQRVLRVVVVRTDADGIRLRVYLTHSNELAKEQTAELTLHNNGSVSGENGMDVLSAEDQLAIRSWMAQFAVAGIFPSDGLKLGEKWKTQEAVASSALAGLVWEKEYTYVRNEVCPFSAPGAGPEHNPRSAKIRICAVLFTRETLKQKSSPKHATPEDFKAHDLRTSGVARGTNEIVSYFELEKGILVRGTEDAHQYMDAEVASVGQDNRVRYSIEGQSHTELLLIQNPADK
jgi:hypothetical protein